MTKQFLILPGDCLGFSKHRLLSLLDRIICGFHYDRDLCYDVMFSATTLEKKCICKIDLITICMSDICRNPIW